MEKQKENGMKQQEYEENLKSITKKLNHLRKTEELSKATAIGGNVFQQVLKQIWWLASEIIGGLTVSLALWGLLTFSNIVQITDTTKNDGANSKTEENQSKKTQHRPIKATLICIGVAGGLYSYIKQLNGIRAENTKASHQIKSITKQGKG